MVLYAIMFLATGACLIIRYQDLQHSTLRDKGLATGSMAIITGIVMVVDFALLVKAILKK